jgi:hypothetical protein
VRDQFEGVVFPNHQLLRRVTRHDKKDVSDLAFNKLELPLTESTLYVEVNTKLKRKGEARQVMESLKLLQRR